MKLARVLGVFLLVAAVGCRGGGDDEMPDGGGGGGDGGADAPPGAEVTIYQLQMGAVTVGSPVTVRGVVVTAIDKFGGRTGTLYVQDPMGGAYSGVLVFGAPLAVVDTLAVGDIVDIEGGKLDEFDCAPCGTPFPNAQTLTEISPQTGGMLTVTKTGTGTPPQPAVVDPVVMATDPVEAEKWEGVLIQVNDVAVTSAPFLGMMDPEDQASMEVTGPYAVGSDMTALDGTGIMRDDCYASMVGIGGYFYEYKLLPRSAADMVAAAGMGACLYEDSVAECSGDASMTDDDHDGFADCADFSCQVADPACVVDATIQEIQMGAIGENTKVRITGAVVTARASSAVWIQDPAGGEYSGIYVFPTMPPAMTLVPGTIVTVEGNYSEYFCMSEIENAVIQVTGMGMPPLPLTVDAVTLQDQGPPPVPPSTCAGPGLAEPYEGVLVQVVNVPIVAIPTIMPDTFGEWLVGDAATPLHVDNMMYSPYTGMTDPLVGPAAGTCMMTVAGPLTFSFDNFKLEPRTAADVVLGGTCP